MAALVATKPINRQRHMAEEEEEEARRGRQHQPHEEYYPSLVVDLNLMKQQSSYEVFFCDTKFLCPIV